MSAEGKHGERESAGKLSIGALSRATGIPIDTLRTWERRYGFPVPERKPSGHRVYSVDAVIRLRRIAEALALGHRAGEVVTASDEELTTLLEAMPGRGRKVPSAPPGAVTHDANGSVPERAIRAYDRESLHHLLLTEWALLGPMPFLKQRVEPLLREIGSGWEEGRFDIRHEHFVSEQLNDLLRSLRLPFEERAGGPLVVLATLPGERHGLGLQMAALVLSVAGLRVLNAGTDLPVEEVAAMVVDLGARAVGISISANGRGPEMTAHLEELRRRLPRRTTLLVGGDGAEPVAGCERISDLDELEAWGRDLIDRASP